MSNFFENVLSDLDGLEEKFMGPSYSYSDHIKTPKQMGMSGDGDAISKNVHGIQAYVQLLFEGGGNASKTQGPLGKQYFLLTGAKCKDVKSGKQVQRSLYINNIPKTKTALSSAMNLLFDKSAGLVPGILNDLENINPLGIFGAFMSGTNPDCMAVTLPTRNANNKVGKETKFMTVHDIKNMSPCWFPKRKNPLTKKRGKNCMEGYQNMSEEFEDPFEDHFEDHFEDLDLLNSLFDIKDGNIFKFSDIVAYVYFTSLIILFFSLIKGSRPL